jgi:3-dehydroquinate dehydratase-2
MLGSREPGIYGKVTLYEINMRLRKLAKKLRAQIVCRQLNHEGELVSFIQKAVGKFDVIVLNAGAYTHTSIAIRDALLAVNIPMIEVHLSNVHKRESFRHKSLLSDIANGVIMGFGPLSYELALHAAVSIVKNKG